MKKTNIYKRILALIITLALVSSSTITAFAVDKYIDPYEKYKTIKDIFQTYEIDVPTTSEMLDAVMKKVLSDHPELFSDLMNAMLKTDEKYTSYFDADKYRSLFSGINYYGIGVLVEIKDDYITAKQIYEGPAKEAGIEVGDRFIKVDDIDITYETIDNVGNMIRGAEGTTVDITIQRPSTNKTLHFTVKRGPVSIPSIEYKILENNIGYISIGDFDGESTYTDFCMIKDKLHNEGIKKVIIDVRNNGGGDGSVLFNMLNQMIEEKGELISTIKTTNGQYPYYSKGEGKKFEHLVVLANENSYSAAEVFAGVVKDLKLGVVVGTTTGGKGKGQQHLPFKDGSILAVSSQIVVLPVTGIYHRIGIIPSVRVSNKLINPDISWLESLKDYSKPLSEGDESNIVKGVEQRLNLLGYLSNTSDEKFDKRTVEAIKDLQKENSMYEDGKINASIIILLNKKIKEYSQKEVYEDTQLKAAISILE